MKAFTESLSGLREFEELEQQLKKEKGIIQVSGCIDAQKAHFISSINNGKGNRIIVTFQEQLAK